MYTFGIYRIRALLFSFSLLANCWALSSMMPDGDPHVRNFSQLEYGAASKNWSISSRANGFIYFANQSGLLEFDGTEWQLYPLPDKTKMRSVKVHNEHTIYTCGYEELGYWLPDDFGRLEYHSLTEKAKSYLKGKNFEFWNIALQKDTVYFQSNSQILSYYSGSFSPIDLGAYIYVMNKVGEKILAAAQNGIIYQIEDGAAHAYITDEILEGKTVRFMLPFGNQQVLIGTARSGMFLWNGQRVQTWKPAWRHFFSKYELNRGHISPKGQFILGTISNGILIFDNNSDQVHKINLKSGLRNNTILGIHTDVWGNIWLALDDGISFIPAHTNSNVRIEQLPEIGAVYGTATFDDKMYLATNQGLYLKNLDGEDPSIQVVEGTQAQTWCCQKFQEKILVGHNQGTFLVDGLQARKISNYPGGFNFTPDYNSENQLLQCTYGDIVKFRVYPGDSISCTRLEGFSDLIQYLETDHLGNIWASHRYKAVYKLKTNDERNKIIEEKYYGEDVFGKESLVHVFKLENQVVFTNSKEIFVFDGLRDTIIPFEKLNKGLGTFKKAHRIIKGPNHHYWFISQTSLGLFQINSETVKKIREFPITLFDDYQLVDEFEHIEPITEHTAILSLRNGFAWLDASRDISKSPMNEFIPVLRGFEMYDGMKSKPISLNRNRAKIKYRYNNLKLRFSFPHVSSGAVSFQHKLEGLDEQWSERTKTPQYVFERLPQGKYTLKVKAIDSWGDESNIIETRFEVLPPFYASNFAYVFYIGFVVLILFVFRTWGLKHAEKKVQEQEILREKEAIYLRNEKLRSEVSHKSKELANSTMALIRKNQFLLDLKRLIEKQKADMDQHYQVKFLNRLNKRIDENISSEDDWHVFEINFEKAHEQFFDKVKQANPELTQNDLRLCAYLRMNLTSKEIAPLMGISVRSVENHRYRLRKKLKLKHEESLIDVILSI